jgi:ribosomal protein L16/L10AE
MFIQPRSIAFKKKFYKNNLLVKQKFAVNQGSFCLVSTTNLCISAPQLRSFILHIRRASKKQAKIWNLTEPQFGITKKPNESRMGKGCGSFSH